MTTKLLELFWLNNKITPVHTAETSNDSDKCDFKQKIWHDFTMLVNEKIIFLSIYEKLCPIGGKVKFDKMEGYCSNRTGILSEKITMYSLCNLFIYTYLRVICHFYRPQTKFAKVMFLHLSVSHSVHREGGLGPGPGGRLGGLAGGMVSRPRPMGEVEGSGWGSRLTLGGGVQTHTQGVSRPTPRRGVQAHTQGGPGPGLGGMPSPRGCIPTCTETDTPPPPQQTATAVGGTHPTGMHSFIY